LIPYVYLVENYKYYIENYLFKQIFDSIWLKVRINFSFNEIIILNKKSGKPYITLSGQTKKIIESKFKKKKIKVSLSLSDETKYAVAFVTISLWKKKYLLQLLTILKLY